jgi:hypothetical protein
MSFSKLSCAIPIILMGSMSEDYALVEVLYFSVPMNVCVTLTIYGILKNYHGTCIWLVIFNYGAGKDCVTAMWKGGGGEDAWQSS